MKNLRNLSILLIILVMICGVFLLSGEQDIVRTKNNLQVINKNFASVAWLEMC